MLFDRMAQRQTGVHVVAMASSDALVAQMTRFLELGDDPLHRALGDADLGRDVAHARLGVLRDAHQHVRVVGERDLGATS